MSGHESDFYGNGYSGGYRGGGVTVYNSHSDNYVVMSPEYPGVYLLCNHYHKSKEDTIIEMLKARFKWITHPAKEDLIVFTVPGKYLPSVTRTSRSKNVLCCAHDGTKAYLQNHLGTQIHSSDREWYVNHPQTESTGLPAHFTFPILQSLVKPYEIGISEIRVQAPMLVCLPEGFTFNDLFGSYMTALGWHPLSQNIASGLSIPSDENVINALEEAKEGILSGALPEAVKERLVESYDNAIASQTHTRFKYITQDSEVWGDAWVITRGGIANGGGGVGHAEYMAPRQKLTNIYQAIRFDRLENCNYAVAPFEMDYDFKESYTYKIDAEMIKSPLAEDDEQTIYRLTNKSFSSYSNNSTLYPTTPSQNLARDLSEAKSLMEQVSPLKEEEKEVITSSVYRGKPLNLKNFNKIDLTLASQNGEQGMFSFLSEKLYMDFEKLIISLLPENERPRAPGLYFVNYEVKSLDSEIMDQIYSSFMNQEINEDGLKSVLRGLSKDKIVEEMTPSLFLLVYSEQEDPEVQKLNSIFFKEVISIWETTYFDLISKDIWKNINLHGPYFNLKNSILSLPNNSTVSFKDVDYETKLACHFVAFLNTRCSDNLLSYFTEPCASHSDFDRFKKASANVFLDLLDGNDGLLESAFNFETLPIEEILEDQLDSFEVILRTLPQHSSINIHEIGILIGCPQRWYELYAFMVSILEFDSHPMTALLKHNLASIFIELIYALDVKAFSVGSA